MNKQNKEMPIPFYIIKEHVQMDSIHSGLIHVNWKFGINVQAQQHKQA